MMFEPAIYTFFELRNNFCSILKLCAFSRWNEKKFPVEFSRWKVFPPAEWKSNLLKLIILCYGYCILRFIF